MPRGVRDEYLLKAALYVEKNPVEAGAVSDPAEYRWGSYRHYGLGKPDPLVDTNPMYENLGRNSKERIMTYRNLIAARISESNKKMD